MEPVGIYASVAISNEQLTRFYEDWGDALIDDVRCIFGKKPGLQRDSSGGFIDPATGHYHNPGNKLVIRYDEATETLFYYYQLELRDPDSMAAVPSFRAFTRIAGYRDRAGADYVAFSPSAPNFLIDSLWRAYQFTRDGLSAIAIDALPPDRQRELDVLSWRYYWGPIEAMFERMDRREDVSYFSNFFPENCFDPPLLSLLGVEKPAYDSRMMPAPYPPSRLEMP
ncbi:hypothetical protein ACN8ZM_36795 [Burkholderia aenigmatica]|uniref:hypothetical protein n=1 Tax=Burkholderia aenigmatica TaxID=2015348 RepID=UPI0004D99BFB|nr:hypothetical protein HR51_25725 [Burkholderia cepacia]